MSYRLDNLKTVRDTAQTASATIGSGTNGAVTLTATAGNPGNLLTVTVAVAVGNSQALAAAKTGNAITITLGTDSGGLADATKNTATLIAAAAGGVSGITAVASGNGTGTILVASGPTTFTGGRDVYSISAIASQTSMSRYYIERLEHGGTCLQEEAQKIADVLGSTLGALGVAL